MKYAFCWVVAALLTEVHCQQFTDVVTTNKGAVRGRIVNTVMNNMSYSLFTNIPFAKPPVGDLRFRLNFTKIERLMPVMIWIYGGAFAAGSTSRNLYGPDLFIENNVIFVDMNYRLGPLGFLALGLDGARGNQGLKDQNMGMQWVQENIANFGGDPNQVTVFGESAGADSVMYHLISPQSKGLFQQAISQSGSPICPWGYHTPEQATYAAYALGEYMGIAAETHEQLLDALKKADIEDTRIAVYKMIWDLRKYPFTLPFNPTMDIIASDPSPGNAYLDDCPISKLQSGNFIRVPTMIGYNKDELNILAIGRKDPDLLRNDMLKRLNELYVSDTTDRSKHFTHLLNTVVNCSISELETIATAFHFTGPIDSTQQMLAKYNDKIPVYYYRLSYFSKPSVQKQLDFQINGTIHGADILLLFCNQSAPHLDPNSEYNMYRKQLVSLWTNFAKYGNPTPHDEPIRNGVWLPSGKDGRQIDLGKKEFKMHGRLLDPITKALEPLYNFYLTQKSACVKHA